MTTIIYYLFATSFFMTAVGGVAMLAAPDWWLAFQKRLVSLAPKPHANAYLKVFENVPVRVIGFAYLVFGTVALYLLVSGVFTDILAGL